MKRQRNSLPRRAPRLSAEPILVNPSDSKPSFMTRAIVGSLIVACLVSVAGFFYYLFCLNYVGPDEVASPTT